MLMNRTLNKISPIVTLILLAGLVLQPRQAKADHPIEAMVVIVGIPMAAVIAGAAIGFLTDSSTETETKETDDQEAETSTTEEGSESGDESRGENEGTPSSAPAKPRITISRTSHRGWFETDESRSYYTSTIPTSIAPSVKGGLGLSKFARIRSVPGVGVEYNVKKNEGNVLLTPSNIKKVEFRKTRRTNFKIVKRGALSREIVVPVRLKINDMTVSTEDIPATSGISSGTVRLLLNNVAVFSATATVAQGQPAVLTGDIKSGEATVELTNDSGSVTGFDKVVRIKIPKGKRSVNLSLEVVTAGRGQRL